MMMLTATYAQKQGSAPKSKQTNYKFKFEYALELESQEEAACDILLELVDRPGEQPRLNMVNNMNGEVQNEVLKPTIVYNAGKEMILLVNADGDEMYSFSMETGAGNVQSCVVLVMMSEDGEAPKAQYGLANETGSPNDEQCMLAYKTLVRNVKANALNNYTVETVK